LGSKKLCLGSHISLHEEIVREPKMRRIRRLEVVPAVFKGPVTARGTAPFPTASARRLLGLDAGDWSMVLLGLVLSGVVLAFV
jgi:hypothetical protein